MTEPSEEEERVEYAQRDEEHGGGRYRDLIGDELPEGFDPFARRGDDDQESSVTDPDGA